MAGAAFVTRFVAPVSSNRLINLLGLMVVALPNAIPEAAAKAVPAAACINLRLSR